MRLPSWQFPIFSSVSLEPTKFRSFGASPNHCAMESLRLTRHTSHSPGRKCWLGPLAHARKSSERATPLWTALRGSWLWRVRCRRWGGSRAPSGALPRRGGPRSVASRFRRPHRRQKRAAQRRPSEDEGRWVRSPDGSQPWNESFVRPGGRKRKWVRKCSWKKVQKLINVNSLLEIQFQNWVEKKRKKLWLEGRGGGRVN